MYYLSEFQKQIISWKTSQSWEEKKHDNEEAKMMMLKHDQDKEDSLLEADSVDNICYFSCD